MNRGQNSDSIPIDLILDILSRLTVKSIARFHCVSKLWGSLLLHKPYFTELFLTRSWARPRLLIVVKQDSKWFLYSSPQPQNPYEKSTLVVAADFHTKISFGLVYYDSTCSYASGLLYFSSIQISEKDKDDMKLICKPSTGQYAILPDPRTTYKREPRTSYNSGGDFLVFDPIGKQFKVLVMNKRVNGECVHHILTLGTETLRWKTIQGPSHHYPLGDGICINGVLYYISYYDYYQLACFDVRSEKFNFILNPSNYSNIGSSYLINYKGKLGVINLEVDYDYGPLKLHMCVLEDVEKSEWSTYVYTLRTDENKVLRDDYYISVIGVTALGEIILAKQNACKPFYVFYFNPERNTLLTVEIQGVREGKKEWYHNQVYVFVDHVEDLKFDVMKRTYAATCISRSEQRTSPKEDHQVRTVAHQREDRRKDHQVRTVAHQQQGRRTFECVNKFDALRFLEDD